jgi:hypothetical protein
MLGRFMGQCKIEKSGVSSVVQELVASGVTTRAAIADILQNRHGLDISEWAVGRYLSRLKLEAKSKAFQIISDHVDKVVPEDLAALESMETLAYHWAMEAAIPQAKRLADAAAKIGENIDYWRSLILSDTPNPADQIKEIIHACLSYVQEDAREQDQRLKAMRAAVQIIELKLSKAGLLDEDTKGKIVIMTRQALPEEESETRRKIIPFSRENLQ